LSPGTNEGEWVTNVCSRAGSSGGAKASGSTGLEGEALGPHQGKAFQINLLKPFTVKRSAQLSG